MTGSFGGGGGGGGARCDAGFDGGLGGYGGGGGGGGGRTCGNFGGFKGLGGFAGGAGGDSCNCSCPGQGGGGGGLGGALALLGGSTLIEASTLYGNGATGGAAGAGIIPGLPGEGHGGGFFVVTGTLSLHSTIVATNTADVGNADCENNPAATVTSTGQNLFGTTGGCQAGGGDSTASDVLLGALADNGGTVHLPDPVGPAIWMRRLHDLEGEHPRQRPRGWPSAGSRPGAPATSAPSNIRAARGRLHSGQLRPAARGATRGGGMRSLRHHRRARGPRYLDGRKPLAHLLLRGCRRCGGGDRWTSFSGHGGDRR